MSNTYMDRANILTEALSYIQRYSGKTVVINCGGAALESKEICDALVSDIRMLRLVGVQVVLVHGLGGNVAYDTVLDTVAKEDDACHGIPKTVVEALQQDMCGKIKKNLVAGLNRAGCKALSMCGVDGALLTAQYEGIEPGIYGQLTRVNPTILTDCMSQGYVPVVASVALWEGKEDTCKVDADVVASKLAVTLKAEKLIQMVRTEELPRDIEGDGQVISEIQLSRVPAHIRSGAIQSHVASKVNASVEAVRSGVTSATLLDGSVPHAILLELLSDEGFGTMLTHSV